MADITVLTESNFHEEVLMSDKPYLVFFWASWAGPSKMMEPHVEKAAEEFAGKLKVGKVGEESNDFLTSTYSVTSFPTLLFFKRGQLIDTKEGAMSPSRLSSFIESNL